ncbi:hypothetical protein [Salinispora arenicola]|uniref:hypothetical protein n=1 Tax=Salinispora arenicola TaxID=168697 RepID=UPI0027DC22F7|nr:hypothetical protein [Salinispora arenicola]
MTAIAGELHVRVTEVPSESARTVVTLVGAGAYAFDPRSRWREAPVGWDGGVANGGERNARAGPAGRAGGIGAVGIESPGIVSTYIDLFGIDSSGIGMVSISAVRAGVVVSRVRRWCPPWWDSACATVLWCWPAAAPGVTLDLRGSPTAGRTE